MKQYSRNARKISEQQLADLEAFLRELGDLSGVVHDLNSDQIIGGNQRSKVFDINECKIEIEHRMKKPDAQGTVALGDEADKLLKHWKVKAGDLWSLGEHRLLCGDSSHPETVRRLLGEGMQAALFTTDPPYMVDYDGTARPGGGKDWGNKYKESTIEDKQQFLTSVFQTWQAYLKPNAAWLIWHASETRALFEQAMRECGVHIHQEIIWVKPVFVIGFATYYFKHEPALFGWPKGKKPFVRRRFFDGRETTVWNDEQQEDVLAEIHQNSSVWFVDWQGKKRNSKAQHPTEKPVEIFARPIRNHTKPGEICLEPFCGSGSQVLAGEQEGRRVYGAELEPAFVAVALQRFQDATGTLPKLLERGK